MHKNILKLSNTTRIYLACCLLCCIAFNCCGQNNKVLSGDTSFWFKTQNEISEKLKLQPLISATGNFHFRYWTDRQAVDIWSIDGINFSGLVTSFINSYTYDEKTKLAKPSQTYSSHVYLDTSLARKAFKLIKNIEAIPTDKFIKGWAQGFDGTEYVFETSTPSTYNFKTYWTPTAQDTSLVEAKMIVSFSQDLDSLLSLRRKYNQFFSTLKPGSYTNGFMITIKLTKKQADYYKKTKPYRDYMDSVKDTLNHFLRDNLTNIFSKYGELKCYDTFLLTFSKNNKLIKIDTNDELTDRDNKKQYKDCKKKIKAAFKLIKIDFVHSKVAYQRKIDYYQGKVNVYD